MPKLECFRKEIVKRAVVSYGNAAETATRDLVNVKTPSIYAVVSAWSPPVYGGRGRPLPVDLCQYVTGGLGHLNTGFLGAFYEFDLRVDCSTPLQLRGTVLTTKSRDGFADLVHQRIHLCCSSPVSGGWLKYQIVVLMGKSYNRYISQGWFTKSFLRIRKTNYLHAFQ